MKIPALLTFLLAAVLSALPLSQARADNDVSFDVFYNSLGDQGDWYNTPDYGYVWQPSIAYQNDKWRPYSDGYWAQTDDGWTWVSYENFGWATYHYGRWTRLENTGWVWVPGYEWGPGWVSWRTNDDYVGWAPLPPRSESNNNGGGGGSSVSVNYSTVEPEDGYNAEVDEQYNIGPSNYCFVETRSFGAPVLREVILPPQRNIVIIENTINVTNITYRRGGPRVVVYNGGPDFGFINGRVDRPIQRLRIEPNVNYDFAHGPRDRNPNVVRDGVFQIAAPRIAPRPMNFNEIKPPTIKRDIRDARVEHGWNNTGADPATVQRLRQQFQTQAHEHPTRPPGNPAANLVPPAAPPQQRERDARTIPPAPPAPPAATPVVSATPPRGNSDADRRARRDAAQHERDARTNGGQPPTPGATPVGRPPAPPRNAPGQPGNDTRREPNTQEVTREPAAAPTPEREATPNRETRGHNRPTNTPASTPAVPPREERRNQPPAEPRAATPNAATEETRRTPRQQERTQPAATPARNTESAPERHPVRTEEPQTRTQTAPPAPRQEIREPRPPTQTAPPAPRQEIREPRPPAQTAPPASRPEVRENREARPQAQPAGSNADDKKKRDGQQ